ncbi:MULTISPECIES: DUF3006 family protein [Corallococcus]|uniref:DUF3006 family protein n=1 Tax=Corallococcus TaxID=83461 RepID=UPI00117D5CD2|nr:MULTISPECIES: DUF3006 family protein [Corallococcus]NBD13637.1 DUF3006 domain-containing protein [Corallococcus silvisoli]TSC34568.1 DUF3006 family protein [Corallococcus sp. Z5C101001]
MGAGALLGLGASPVRVELLEDTRALVVRADGGQACTVERWRLPPGAREGDVIVDGRLDLERTEALRREVARKRAQLAVPLPPGLEL